MTINPRSTALDILIAYERDGVYPNLLLKKSLKDIKVDRDKRFISALVYGVIEKKLLLDFYISHVSSVKIKKINTIFEAQSNYEINSIRYVYKNSRADRQDLS